MGKILFSVNERGAEIQSEFQGPVKSLISRLDGTPLDGITIKFCALDSAQDCDDLIAFLRVHRSCFDDALSDKSAKYTTSQAIITDAALASQDFEQATALQKINSDIQAVHEDKQIRLDVCKELIRSYTSQNRQPEMGVPYEASKICKFIITGKTPEDGPASN